MINKYLQQLVWVAIGYNIIMGEAAVEGLLIDVGKLLANIIKKIILALILLKGSKNIIKDLIKGLAEGVAEFKLLLIFFI